MNKSFQVDTEGSVELKKFLVDMFVKYVNSDLDGVETLIAKNSYNWLQFVFNESYAEHGNVCHTTSAYEPKLYPVVTIPEAINRLISYSNTVVTLNDNYVALVLRNGDVQVGSQTFSANAILNLAKEVKKKL